MPGWAVAVSPSDVANKKYMLTPHTYRVLAVEKGEESLRKIQSGAEAVEKTRTAVVESLSGFPAMTLGEIGAHGIPSGWSTERLGEICDIKVGPSALKRSSMVADGPVSILGPTNLQLRRIDTHEIDRTTPEVAQKFADWRVRKDDLLLVRVGQVQKAAIAAEEHSGYLINSNLTRLRMKEDKAVIVISRYLLEYLLRDTSIRHMLATATVNVASSMSGAKLADFPILVPPQEEQAAVVGVLVDRQHRITALRNALEAEEQLRSSLAEGLMTGSVGLVP